MIVPCELCGKALEIRSSEEDEGKSEDEKDVYVVVRDQVAKVDRIFCLMCFYILFEPHDLAYA